MAAGRAASAVRRLEGSASTRRNGACLVRQRRLDGGGHAVVVPALCAAVGCCAVLCCARLTLSVVGADLSSTRGQGRTIEGIP